MAGEDGLVDQALLRSDGPRGFRPVVDSLGPAESLQLYQHRLLGVLDAPYREVDTPRSLCFARLPADIDDQQRPIVFCRAPGEVGGRVGTVVHALVGRWLDAGVALGLGDDWRGARSNAGSPGWLLPEPPGSLLADPELPRRLGRLDASPLRAVARLRLDDRRYEARLAAYRSELVRLVDGLLRAGNERLAVFGWRSDPLVLLTAAREILRTHVCDDWSFSTGESVEKSLFRITFLLPGSHAVAVGQFAELDQDPVDSQHWLDAGRLVDAYQQRGPAEWQEEIASAGVEDRTSLLEWARRDAPPSRRQLESLVAQLPGLQEHLRAQQEELDRLEKQRPEREKHEKAVASLSAEVDQLKRRLEESEAGDDRWRPKAEALAQENARWADESGRLADPAAHDVSDFLLLGPVAQELFGLRDRVSLWEQDAGRLLDRQLRSPGDLRFLRPVAEELLELRLRVGQWEHEAAWLLGRRGREATDFQVLGRVAQELFGLRADSQQWQLEAGWLYAQQRPEVTEFRMLRRPAEELFHQRDVLAEWELEAKRLTGRTRHEVTDFVHLRRVADTLNRIRSGQAQLDARAELDRWQIERQWILERRVDADDAFEVLQPVAEMVSGLMSDYASARHENAYLTRLNMELQYAGADWYDYAEDLRKRLHLMKSETAALALAAAPEAVDRAPVVPSDGDDLNEVNKGSRGRQPGEQLPAGRERTVDEAGSESSVSSRGGAAGAKSNISAATNRRYGLAGFTERNFLPLTILFLALLVAAMTVVIVAR